MKLLQPSKSMIKQTGQGPFTQQNQWRSRMSPQFCYIPNLARGVTGNRPLGKMSNEDTGLGRKTERNYQLQTTTTGHILTKVRLSKRQDGSHKSHTHSKHAAISGLWHGPVCLPPWYHLMISNGNHLCGSREEEQLKHMRKNSWGRREQLSLHPPGP